MNYSNPFRRLVVFNSVLGTTYIFWEMARWMEDPGPYTAQLQVARMPNPKDSEWTNVGEALPDPPFLTDSVTQSNGKILDKFYRIIFTTGIGVYTSPIGHCFGQLTPREWKIAREVIRKERLRFGYTAVPVTVLKKKRSGEKCSHCISDGLSESTNSECPYCYGTGFLGGYHTPFSMNMMDISPSQLREIHHTGSVSTFNVAVDKYQARALGLPELNEGDIIIDRSTDQRFVVNTSPVIAQMHRVPLVRQVEMSLLAASDVAYTIGADDGKSIKGVEEILGCGDYVLDEEYEGLSYTDEAGNPIEGVTITVTCLINEVETVVGTTYTDADGKWHSPIKVDPGAYKVTFEKPGKYGPDSTEITIESPPVEEIDYLNAF